MVTLPSQIIDRVMKRRGRLHIVNSLDSERTALLIVDMQNAYLRQGQPAFVASGEAIVSNINRLVGSLRGAGGCIVWLRNTLGAEVLQSWPVYGTLRQDGVREEMLSALEEGSPGHALWPEMDIRTRDLVINKRRYSAFIQGSSDLDSRLREISVDTLLITGVLANVCCESTARDAMMLNYRVVMVSDATAAHTEAEHVASLANILLAFGDVMGTDEVLGMVRSSVK